MNVTCKSCGSCGMPLASSADYSQGDMTQAYCIFCTDSQGHLKSYPEVLQGMTNYLVHSQGIDRTVALALAEQTLKTLPAWKDKVFHA